MADPLAQIQQKQMQDQERFAAERITQRQHDLDWRSTFDQIPPDQVLRDTRNMTDLVNNAIERKMELAAQTDVNAQKIYLNNQRFKSWQNSQALRDDHTRTQMDAEDALTRSRTAKSLLEQSNAARKARDEEQTALAHWEMNQIEDNPSATEADKLAQLRSFGGRYPKMDTATRQRHTEMVSRYAPLTERELATHPIPKTDEEKIAFEKAKTAARIETELKLKPPTASVTETTTSVNTPADINLPVTTTHRAVTSKQPLSEIKRQTPMTGKEFLDSIKR